MPCLIDDPWKDVVKSERENSLVDLSTADTRIGSPSAKEPCPALFLEGEERCPNRDSTCEVAGAVYGVDDPAPRMIARASELLASDTIARTSLREPRPDCRLHLSVGCGHA